MQDVSGLQPVFQNFGQQQANQQAALAQQNQLANQAGQSQGGGMNPLAMAAMLRKKPDDGMNLLNNSSSSQDYMNKIGAYGGTQVQGSDPYANESWMK
jgi:hypothetical protein